MLFLLSFVSKTIINMLFIFLNKRGVSNFIKNMFNFIKNCQGVLKFFHFMFPATEYKSSTFHPYQHWVLSVLFILATLMGVFVSCRFNLHFVTINVEHLCICFLAILMYSVVKCLSKSSAHWSAYY